MRLRTDAGLITLAFASVLVLHGCGSDKATAPKIPAKVVISQASVNLSINEQFQLNASVTGGDSKLPGTIVWTSSDIAVATVGPTGTVDAVGPGTAQIRATSRGVTAIATVTVTIPAVSLGIAAADSSLIPGDTATFKATLAGGDPRLSATPVWSSTNPAVLTVSTNGRVTAVAVGTAEVRATARGATASASLKIEQAQVGDGTVVADSTKLVLTAPPTATGQMTFQNSGNVQVKTGDILVGTQNGGYLRKVESVQTSGSTLMVNTVKASIEQAVEDMELHIAQGDFSMISANGTLDAGARAWARQLPPGVRLMSDGSVHFQDVALLGGTLGLDGASATVSVTGNLQLLFGRQARADRDAFVVDAEIGFFELDYFKAVVTAGLRFNAGLTVAVTGNLAGLKSAELSANVLPPYTVTRTATGQPGPTCTYIGVFPLCYTISVKFPAYARLSANATGTFQGGVSVDIAAEAGGTYNGEVWQPIFNQWGGATANATGNLNTGQASLRFGIVPQVEVLFYDFVGPFVGLDGGVQLTVGAEPWSWFADVSTFVDLVLGLRAEVFDFTLAEYSFSTNLWTQSLARTGGDRATVTMQPENSTIRIGETVQLSATANHFITNQPMPVTPGFEWLTDNDALATVNQNGLVTGVRPGLVKVGARIPGTNIFDIVNVTVIERPLISLTTTPSPLTVAHTFLVSPCPQAAGLLNLTNLSGQTLSITVTPGNDGIATQPSSSTLSGSGSTYHVSFTCNIAESFNTTLTVTARTLNGEEEHTIVVPFTAVVTKLQ